MAERPAEPPRIDAKDSERARAYSVAYAETSRAYDGTDEVARHLVAHCYGLRAASQVGEPREPPAPSERAIAAGAEAGNRFGTALSDSGFYAKIEAIGKAMYAVDFPVRAGAPPTERMQMHITEGTVATGGHFTPTDKGRPDAATLLRQLLDLDMPEADDLPIDDPERIRIRLRNAGDTERGASKAEIDRPTLGELRALSGGGPPHEESK